MGIPGFNTWFNENYARSYVPLSQVRVDHLYIGEQRGKRGCWVSSLSRAAVRGLSYFAGCELRTDQFARQTRRWGRMRPCVSFDVGCDVTACRPCPLAPPHFPQPQTLTPSCTTSCVRVR